MPSIFVRPGVIEGFAGPMKSGKSSALLKRVDPLRWIHGKSFIGFKPETDNREKHCRSTENFIGWINIPSDNPEKIFEHVTQTHDLIVIDEIQFFNKKIVGVILKLQKLMKNIIFAGLDRDFRGEPFGSMEQLMFHTNELTKLYAICNQCGEPAYYTQRLIDGEPAPYGAPIVSIEGKGKKEEYEARCFKHHIVPRE
ncbi:thymidine kinase [archaeon]|nr:thymidine kinase [archaeon]